MMLPSSAFIWFCSVLLLATNCVSVTASTNFTFGVCWYPEQWPVSMLESDVQRMRDLGIQYVRIGEFSWSIIEPTEGQYNWDILDLAFDLTQKYGIQVVLGTPTATPPKWLIDTYPSVLPVGKDGQIRHFGSRRHYSFSSPIYRNHSMRITTAMAQRYGRKPSLAGWQLDNEYGCHDTVRTYDDNAKLAFRVWLKNKYNTIDALNKAWGNTFWSMNYNNFDEIDLPNLTVTEPNPSHSLDFYRFSSDQVVSFNKEQLDIIRFLSPGKFATTNFMGFFFDFDHFALADNLDFASWDSYPLGHTDTFSGLSAVEKAQWARSGHPDITSFHHDLYRAVGKGKFWIMEQQPGPVNWATDNPSPAPGMIALWSWQAFAHGASTVSYFRWRQSHAAQEQMHAGLNRPDNTPDMASHELQYIQSQIKLLPSSSSSSLLSSSSVAASASASSSSLSSSSSSSMKSSIAIIFDYESFWISDLQPQGSQWSHIELLFDIYSTLRSLSFNIDFLPIKRMTSIDLNILGYKMIVISAEYIMTNNAVEILKNFKGQIVIMPRTGAKTVDFQVPSTLPPYPLADLSLLPIRIQRVESLPPLFEENIDVTLPTLSSLSSASSSASSASVTNTYISSRWREYVYIDTEKATSLNMTVSVVGHFQQDQKEAIIVTSDSSFTRSIHYFAFYPSKQLLKDYFISLSSIMGLSVYSLPSTIRITTLGNLQFAFNFDFKSASVPFNVPTDAYVVGNATIPPYGVSVYKCPSVPASNNSSTVTNGNNNNNNDNNNQVYYTGACYDAVSSSDDGSNHPSTMTIVLITTSIVAAVLAIFTLIRIKCKKDSQNRSKPSLLSPSHEQNYSKLPTHSDRLSH